VKRKPYVRSSNALVDMRKAQNLSQTNVATLLGTTQSTIKRWESGSQRLYVEDAVALADTYGVDVSLLIKTYMNINKENK
jgi:transcriptional regulator with XRE-family HTH domain